MNQASPLFKSASSFFRMGACVFRYAAFLARDAFLFAERPFFFNCALTRASYEALNFAWLWLIFLSSASEALVDFLLRRAAFLRV